MAIEDLRMCEVCHRVLSVLVEKDGTITMVHSGQDTLAGVDHEPDPVPVDGRVRIRCDFCNAETPQHACWTLPTATFVELEIDDTTHMSGGDFAACGTCAELIDADRWGLLVRRARFVAERRLNKQLDPVVVQALQIHLANVRMHMLGPPYLESEL